MELRREYVRKPQTSAGDKGELKSDFSRDVLVIQLSPGMGSHYFDAALDARNPDTQKTCEGVIIRTLGSGNIPTAPIDYTAFVRHAVERGISVLISSLYPWHPDTRDRYAPGAAGAQAGAILAPTMTPATAETKFRWLLAQLAAQNPTIAASARTGWIKERMQTDYIGELDGESFGKAGQSTLSTKSK